MAKLTVMYWRDIPSQVLAQQSSERYSVMLSARFQEAIESPPYCGKADAGAISTTGVKRWLSAVKN